MSELANQEAVSLDSLVAEVADEFLERKRRGEQPDIAEYIARYPHAAEVLPKVLAALEVVGFSATGLAADSSEGGASGTLGDYRIFREIGRGGMGLVYEAEQISLERRVALKVLPFASTLDPRHLQRFQNEARAAACLHHPHIVPVYAVGCERGVHYYAMQFIEGMSLDTLLRDLRQEQSPSPSPSSVPSAAPDADATVAHSQPAPDTLCVLRGQASTLPEPSKGRAYYRRVAELMTEAAEALEYAHQSGIVHRDVKPANLMLDQRGQLWVADFGLAQIQSDARVTMTGDLVGTLRYMSPEQALAKRVIVDLRTDVYSLGATLYEMLTLRPAFEGADRQELLRQIAFEEPVAARKHNRAIPVELETIAAKALEKNPADRYGSMKELAEDLRRYLKDEPIKARRAGMILKTRKLAHRHRGIAATIGVAALLIFAVLAVGLGWVLRDRAVREAETEGAVNAALAEAGEMQVARKIPEALAKVKQAAAILASGAGTDKYHQKVQARLADLQFAADLEDLRADRAAHMVFLEDAYIFDYPGADRLYGERFRAFGVDIDALTIEDANRRFAASSVRLEIAAGLDDWYFVARKARPKEPELWKRLLVVAKATDPDTLRNQARDVLTENKVDSLKSLAAALNVEALSAGTAVVLGYALVENKANDEAVALLTKTQWRHPGDFWVNFALARALGERAKGNDRAEAITFYRAAIALRPESSGAWHNLGAELRKTQRQEEAIIAFREAIRLYPQNEWTHDALGQVFVELKQWHAAIGEFQQIGKADLNAPMRSRGRITHVFAVSGQLQAALESAEELRQFNSTEAYACIGQIRERLGDVHGAIEAYKQTVSFRSEKPVEPRSLERLAWLLPPEEALEFAVAAVGKNPQKNTYNALGIAQYRNKNWDGCINAMQKAAELRAEAKASHLFFMAMAHNQRGEYALACSLYQKAMVWMEDYPFRDDDYAMRGYRAEAAALLGVPLPKSEGNETSGAMK